MLLSMIGPARLRESVGKVLAGCRGGGGRRLAAGAAVAISRSTRPAPPARRAPTIDRSWCVDGSTALHRRVTVASGTAASLLSMPHRLTVLLAVPLAMAFASPAGAAKPSGPAVVTTDNETPVLYDDDAGGNASGDDPATWVHPDDSSASIVIVTAKEGGLRVYDLAGAELQSIAASPAPRGDGVDGRYNNVDIAYGLELDRGPVDIAVVS